MATAILKDIVYESEGKYEIYVILNNGKGENYFVNKVDERTPTRQNIEELIDKKINYKLHVYEYTTQRSSIDVITKIN